MSLSADSALGFDPPERIPLPGPDDAIAWARTIPDFGWYPEVYVLFLDADRSLRRAAWLGSTTRLDDFVPWPDFSLGYRPAGGTDAVMLLVCRPGEGVEPTPDDRQVFELLRSTHEALGVHLVDVLLVDGRRWTSMARR
ncbi:MAG: hypothetical protein QOI86_3791 [Actinomycetota bacterium]|nr:hypothetical protein [Actinomycetota bacterium]